MAKKKRPKPAVIMEARDAPNQREPPDGPFGTVTPARMSSRVRMNDDPISVQTLQEASQRMQQDLEQQVEQQLPWTTWVNQPHPARPNYGYPQATYTSVTTAGGTGDGT